MPRRLFYGWIVVAASAIGLFLGAFPIVAFSFGVFFPSFAREFGGSRAAISLAFTVHNVLSGVLAVFIGRIADRVGARRIILPGLALLGVMLVSAVAIGRSLWELYLFYAALAVVAPATTTVPYALVVSRWFDRRRGMAIGLMMIGLGAGAIVMPIVAQRLIAALGWRNAFAAVGCAILLIPIPIVGRLLRDAPEDMQLAPDGDAAPAFPVMGAPPAGLTWNESRRSGTFWSMIVAFVLLAASVHACVIHLPELFADRGATPAAAAVVSSVVGAALLIGRIGSGYFLDRVFGPYVAFAICGLSALGVAVLWLGAPGRPALAAAFLVGLGMGSEVDIIAFLMGRYFGLRALGRTIGFAFGAFVVAGGVGPLVMGYAFDRTGSYRVPLAGFFAATLVAAAILGRLGPYRYGVAPGSEARTTSGRENAHGLPKAY
jgi:MFS family permease